VHVKGEGVYSREAGGTVGVSREGTLGTPDPWPAGGAMGEEGPAGAKLGHGARVVQAWRGAVDPTRETGTRAAVAGTRG
jgi:hypothetical protein